MKSNTEQTMILKYLWKVGSECDLNSWPDSSIYLLERVSEWNLLVVGSIPTEANFL